jgi:hypothetical protein
MVCILNRRARRSKNEHFFKPTEIRRQNMPVNDDQGAAFAQNLAIQGLVNAMNQQSAEVELPLYTCHKQVRALKIKEFRQAQNPPYACEIIPEEPGFTPIVVSREWVTKHKPVAGGYYVVYKDGYKSFSPAEAFEDGYSLANAVPEPPPVDNAHVAEGCEQFKGRTITDHKLEGLNDALRIDVLDAPGQGGACHQYLIHTGGLGATCAIQFQNGPIKEFGVNGVSGEALVAVVIDRLRSFQAGSFACRENAVALIKLEEAMMWLQKRTRDRLARGVEGTNQK